LAAELLEEFEPEIEAILLVPSDGGRFEVSVDDRLIFSKLQTHRHADPGEVAGILRKMISG